MSNGFIYLWTNKNNGKRYIGSHMGTPDDGYLGSGSVFRRAVAKHGLDAFERIILEHVENVDRKGLEAREQHYLDLYDAAASKGFYNVRAVAGGGWEHVNSCPILGEKNRQRARENGKIWGANRKGIKLKPHTEEAKELRRVASKKWAQENTEVPVHRFDFSGNLVESYPCIQEAAKDVGTSPSNVLYAARGKFKQIAGWRWSFKSDPLEPLDFRSTQGKKRVQTPDGVFDSVTAVVNHYGLSSTKLVRDRCLSSNPKWDGWSYLELKSK